MVFSGYLFGVFPDFFFFLNIWGVLGMFKCFPGFSSFFWGGFSRVFLVVFFLYLSMDFPWFSRAFVPKVFQCFLGCCFSF